MSDPRFRREQRGVGIRMLGAVIVTAAAIAAALAHGAALPMTARVRTVTAVDLIVLAWLTAAIGNVARLRFVSPDDIAAGSGSGGSGRVREASAILQNTLEQVVLAVPVHIAAAIAIERSVPLLIVLGGLFSAGRALFWRGYARGAAARALGFALTFYPTVAVLVVVLVAIAAR